MKKIVFVVPLVCSIAALQGCQSISATISSTIGSAFGKGNQDAMHIEPAYSVQHSDMSPEGLFKLGQQFQRENKPEQAAETYRTLLTKEPGHIDARNALASIYAAQNKLDDALAELRTIVQRDPKFARGHNNLGYVYYLKKDYTAAISELGTAIALDPANARAYGNLALVYQQLGEADKARAASLRAVDVSETRTAKAAPADDASEARTAKLVPSDDMLSGVKSAMASAAKAAGKAFNIEIANGTRDERLASSVEEMLSHKGFAVNRITGLEPYTQRRTVILYRDGYEKEAVALSRSFPKRPAVVNNTRSRGAADQSDVRVVLGKETQQAVQLAQHGTRSMAN